MLDNAKPQPILESKNLHLYYGETEALKGIDMKIGKTRSPRSSARRAAANPPFSRP